MLPSEVADDFRNFMFLVWQHLGLPNPTPAQYELGWFLQHGFETAPGVGRREILEGFRGVAKSTTAAAYALWRLGKNPVEEKILVASASGVKAKEFVAQAKGILMTMPMLEFLRPRYDQRDMVDRFDVNGARNEQSPSMKAAGITGQITGSRATLILPDDIEIVDNSKTEAQRANLLRITQDFEAIILPGGDIVYLGTPQTEESIYNTKIKTQGYNCFCWPARYPDEEKRKNYLIKRDSGEIVDILAAPLKARLESDPSLVGKATDPERFDDAELARREARGRAFFALQYMLDTSLSDAERYPLRARDLIVMSISGPKAPMTVTWGKYSDGRNVLHEIPNYGFTGDFCMGPLFIDQEWREFTGSVLFVDPGGRGKDENAWAIVKVLNGVFYLCDVGGIAGDPEEAMRAIARAAKAHRVNCIAVEPNFAPGVWIAAFQPILAQEWPGGCSVIEAEWARGSKEARICDTLEPVLAAHRLVVDERVARDEKTMYQLTHITRERGALRHDDRIDAIAGAVAHFERALMEDQQKARAATLQAEWEREQEDQMRFLREGVTRVVQSRRLPDGRIARRIRYSDEIEHYSS